METTTTHRMPTVHVRDWTAHIDAPNEAAWGITVLPDSDETIAWASSIVRDAQRAR